MMVPNFLRSRPAAAVFAAVVILLLVGAAHQLPASEYFSPSSRSPSPERVDDSARVFIPSIYSPSTNPDDKVYQPYGAFEFKVPEDRPKAAQWPNPQGKKLCILDLDSRPQDGRGEIFGKDPLSWNIAPKISGPSLGILQHWLYAKIHGYQYYYVETGDFSDRRASWKKPTIIRRVLEKHPTVVFLDSDAVVNHLDLPFEWLLNYWSINRDNDSLAMAVDPTSTANKDEKGRVYANTGFIIAQNRTRTLELLDDWTHCADDGGKYPDCVEYRDKYRHHPSDQGGFGNYVRYDYDDDIRELPCEEANGFPEHGSGCKGTFVKHLWTGKSDLLKIAVGEMMPGALLQVLHKQMLEEKEQFYIREHELMSDAWLNGSPLDD